MQSCEYHGNIFSNYFEKRHFLVKVVNRSKINDNNFERLTAFSGKGRQSLIIIIINFCVQWELNSAQIQWSYLPTSPKDQPQAVSH